MRLLDQRADHRAAVAARDLGQHDVARMTFDQGHDVAVRRAAYEIALPVTGHRPVLDRSRAIADRDRIDDLAALVSLGGRMARTPDRPLRTQMRLQLLLQDASGLDEQAAIDRLVRHAICLVTGIRALQPAGNLLGRPVLLELAGDDPPQRLMHCQLAPLRTQCPVPRSPVRGRGAVVLVPTVAPQLAAHRRRGTAEIGCDRTQRHSPCQASGYLLPLRQAQHAHRTSSRRRPDPAGRLEMRKDRRRVSAERAPNQLERLASLPAIPDLRALSCGNLPYLSHGPPHLLQGKVLRRSTESAIPISRRALALSSPRPPNARPSMLSLRRSLMTMPHR